MEQGYPPLQQIAGNVGRDPSIKTTSKGEITVFTLAVPRGYGDNAPTDWYDVAVFNEQLQPVVRSNIHRGNRVVVEGVVSQREHNGRTFNDIRANRVGLVEWLRRDQVVEGDI